MYSIKSNLLSDKNGDLKRDSSLIFVLSLCFHILKRTGRADPPFCPKHLHVHKIISTKRSSLKTTFLLKYNFWPTFLSK